MSTTTERYVVIWKTEDTPRVSTAVNEATGENITYTRDDLEPGISIADEESKLNWALRDSSGEKYAVPASLAKSYLGWDV